MRTSKDPSRLPTKIFSGPSRLARCPNLHFAIVLFFRPHPLSTPTNPTLASTAAQIRDYWSRISIGLQQYSLHTGHVRIAGTSGNVKPRPVKQRAACNEPTHKDPKIPLAIAHGNPSMTTSVLVDHDFDALCCNVRTDLEVVFARRLAAVPPANGPTNPAICKLYRFSGGQTPVPGAARVAICPLTWPT